MAEPRFTIRYRQHLVAVGLALLVEDAAGTLFVCTGQSLRPFLPGSDGDLARRAATLRALGWVPVPAVAPYSLGDLRRLLDPVAA